MLMLLTETWGLLLLRGVLAIAFGIMAVTLPGLTLTVLILLFGAYAFASGIVTLAAAYGTRAKGKGRLIFEGILGIAAGIIAFAFPGMTAIALLALVSAWSLINGAIAMAGAFALRKEITGEWRLYLAGALSILFGIMLVLNAQAGMLALVWVLGLYAVLLGGALVSLALRVRHLAHEMRAAH